MKKNYFFLGISGGPNAGKTLLIGYLFNIFTDMGYKVLIIPEAATFWMNLGIPQGSNFFQKSIISFIKMAESTAVEYAKKHPDEFFLIISDRTLLDGMAYIDEISFERLLIKQGLDIRSVSNYYDAVIYLETAAKGAPGFFGKKTNEHRYEDIDGAIRTCNTTLGIIKRFVPEYKLRVVYNDAGLFSEKLFSAYQNVCALMNLPVPINQGEKFLLKSGFSENDLMGIDYNVVSVMVDFLPFTNGSKPPRLRVKKHHNDVLFFHTEERVVGVNDRFQIEKSISEHEYNSLLGNKDSNTESVQKDRFSFEQNGFLYEIDVFKKPLVCKGLATLKVTATKAGSKEPQIPSFLKVDKLINKERFNDYTISKSDLIPLW